MLYIASSACCFVPLNLKQFFHCYHSTLRQQHGVCGNTFPRAWWPEDFNDTPTWKTTVVTSGNGFVQWRETGVNPVGDLLNLVIAADFLFQRQCQCGFAFCHD